MKAKLLCLIVATSLSAQGLADRLTNEPIKPIEPAKVSEPDKVELGKKLFSIRACRDQASYPATRVTT